MEIISWVIVLVLFGFLALAVFGSVASRFMEPTPFIGFCQRLWSLFQLANLRLAQAVLILMVLLLAIVIVAKLVLG